MTTVQVHYLKDIQKSLVYQFPDMAEVLDDPLPVFPDDYEFVTNLDISWSVEHPERACEVAWRICQNGLNYDEDTGQLHWEPAYAGFRSMVIGDVVVLGETAYRAIDVGFEAVKD